MAEKSRREFIQTVSTAAGLTPLAAKSIFAYAEQGAAGTEMEPEEGSVRMMEGTGAQLVVEQLRAAGVKYIIHTNTSGVDALMDAVVDAKDMKVVMVTHEGQATSTVEGYALASGEMAFFIGSSNGLDNAQSNLHNAWVDGTPMIISFEDGNPLAPLAHFSVWNWECQTAESMPAMVRRAMKAAVSPPGGPVTMVFPGSFGRQKVKAPIHSLDLSPKGRAMFRAPSDSVERLAKWLVEAKNPLFVVGREVSRSAAHKDIVALAEKLSVPVCQAARNDNLFCDFPTDHPLYLSNYLSPMRYPEKPDVFVNFGARYSNRPSSEEARIAHVSFDPNQLDRELRVHLPILADVGATIRDVSSAIDGMLTADRAKKIRTARFDEVTAYAKSMRQSREVALKGRFDQTPISWERLGYELEQALEKDAVVVPELGSQEMKLLEQMKFGPQNKLRLGRTEGGQLGWGLGAAFGAQLALPNRQVASLLGDGGIMFGQTETFWSLSRYDAPVLVVILNNHSYNETRVRNLGYGGAQFQAKKDMTSYLGSPNIEFVKIASAYGIQGEHITGPGDLAAAIKRGIAATRNGRPFVLDVEVSRDGILSDSTWYAPLSIAQMGKQRS